MTKLKLKMPSDIGDILTREERKHVFGGYGSESGSDWDEFGSDNISKDGCGTGKTPKIDACRNLKSRDRCCFHEYPSGALSYGKCVSIYGGPLHCSDLN